MKRKDAEKFAEHLQRLANGIDPGIQIVPAEMGKGDWALHITDAHEGNWFTWSYAKVKDWLMWGA